jgi:ketosteroid isomerase-like protein
MASPTPALEQIQLAMASTNKIFNDDVFGRGDFDALDKIYTAGARILPPGSPMIAGRPAIKDFWSGFIRSVNATAAVLRSIDVMQAGEEIVEIGSAVLTIQPAGQPQAQLEAKYLVYWRQEDGHWKWHVDIWNLNA